MYENYRQKLFPTLSRASPAIFGLILFINCAIKPSYETFYIFVMYFIVMLSNYFIKNLIFRPIYKLLGANKIKFLGLGERPNGADSCCLTLDNKLSNSFGMPSGHSQTAWTLATYILFKISYDFKNNNNKNIKTNIWFALACILIISIASYISYSRVYIDGCHTLQQVIVGAIIGIVSGFLIYYFEDNIKSLINL